MRGKSSPQYGIEPADYVSATPPVSEDLAALRWPCTSTGTGWAATDPVVARTLRLSGVTG
jgi:hypothetical protein